MAFFKIYIYIFIFKVFFSLKAPFPFPKMLRFKFATFKDAWIFDTSLWRETKNSGFFTSLTKYAVSSSLPVFVCMACFTFEHLFLAVSCQNILFEHELC